MLLPPQPRAYRGGTPETLTRAADLALYASKNGGRGQFRFYAADLEHEANLRKLLAGRIDAYPMSKDSGNLLIERLFSAEDRAKLSIAARPLDVTEGYLLISRGTDGAEAIAAALQGALDGRELASR